MAEMNEHRPGQGGGGQSPGKVVKVPRAVAAVVLAALSGLLLVDPMRVPVS